MEKLSFFGNIGGLNVTDTPFYVQDNQATGGFNYEYLKTGGITKRRGDAKVNSSADSDTKVLGMHTHTTKLNARTILKTADAKLKSISLSTGVSTAITEDTTAAGTSFFSATSTQPVVFAQHNPPTNDISWFCGGGSSTIYGYNGTKVTQNGVSAPTGTFSGVVSLTGGSWTTTGTYFYAVALRKASTQALSNAALDFSAVIANTTDKVTITLPTVSDTTKYDKFYIYRSSPGGVTSFTTGVLVAIVDSTASSYVDTGSALTVVDLVPREDNALLDNSTLPSGTYTSVVVWKNQLITAAGNTVYFSDPLKPESWPSLKSVTVAGASDISALAVVNFNSKSTASTDEYLVVFSENKMFIIVGTGLYDSDLDIWDLSLYFVDSVGCSGQASIVNAYGYLLWMDITGIYAWDANGKPKYISRLIESLYNQDGDFDKANASITVGKFFRKQKQIQWFIPHKTYGENKVSLVLDCRLTFMSMGDSDLGNVSDSGIFTMNKRNVSIYGATTTRTDGNNELLLLGDDNGFVYNAQVAGVDQVPTSVDSTGTMGVEFDYYTKWADVALPGEAKRFHKLVVFVESLTPDDLTLEYWADYRNGDSNKSQNSVTMDSSGIKGTSLWDVAYWDVALWDDYSPTVVPVVFNLASGRNNNEGDSIRFRFKQFDENVPVVILGFNLYTTYIGLRK